MQEWWCLTLPSSGFQRTLTGLQLQPTSNVECPLPVADHSGQTMRDAAAKLWEIAHMWVYIKWPLWPLWSCRMLAIFRSRRRSPTISDRPARRNQTSLSALIWSVADLLRGDYKPSEYGRVILPFTVLRRLDCVLATSKPKVLAEKKRREAAGLDADPFLRRV